jgi:tetratricopeptide (TPR) repeat protein
LVPAAEVPPAPPPEPPPDEAGADQIVVTGTRIARPNLDSASPITVVGSRAAASAGRAASARSARRGDWNACTIEDPRRSLAGCRVSAETADGLERAWKGDWDGAGRAFDSAVAAAPRSSAAWLNRGLLRRRSGDLERALADLDRAVRFSPRAARYYYHRSLVLRQIGDFDRARADEARAVELDPRYAPLVPAPEPR